MIYMIITIIAILQNKFTRLWKTSIEEAGEQKNDFSNYEKYQMVDERSVDTQSYELQKEFSWGHH